MLTTPPASEQNTDVIRTDDTEIGGTFTRRLGQKATLEMVGLRQTRDQAIDSDFDDGVASSFAPVAIPPCSPKPSRAGPPSRQASTIAATISSVKPTSASAYQPRSGAGVSRVL